ncbi:MAG: hypothetical protein WC044_06125 [Crocinitomicaceae bacterium]
MKNENERDLSTKSIIKLYRLIINTKSEFDTVICELLVSHFGELEIIPFSDRFCIVQAIKIDDEKEMFVKASEFTENNPEVFVRALLTMSKSTNDDLVELLYNTCYLGFFSDIEPPLELMGNQIRVENNLWTKMPLTMDDEIFDKLNFQFPPF